VDELRDLYAQGADDTEVAAALRLPIKEFHKRVADDELFAQLVQFGRQTAKAWWMKVARKAVQGGANGGFNYWWAVMRNQYGWSDKAEQTEGKPVQQLTRDELLNKLAELGNKVKKVPDRLQMTTLLNDSVN